jgi:hypothetical protein
MAGGDEGSYGLVPGEDPPDRPRVVDEADEVLTAYTWQLLGVGGVTVLAWAGAGFFGAGMPALIPILVLVALVLLFLAPVTREPRLAREVVRRWDRLRVERALESSGIGGDPRLEVAEAMADRVLRHPSVDQRVRDATSSLVAKLRMVLRDLRRVEYLTDARGALSQSEMTRSISDLQDLLDARAAELLGQIAELHRTVVLRDAAALERVMDHVEDLANELQAEREVERLLSDAERS